MTDTRENEILAKEAQILAKLDKEEKEIAQEGKEIKRVERSQVYLSVFVGLLIIGVAGGLTYWKTTSTRIYVENSLVSAPEIDLAPQTGGILEAVYVNEGDQVAANALIARVGNELVKAKVAGTIISLQNNIGASIAPGQTVATEIDPATLRVVGSVDENGGLSAISVGDPAIFTVDAFGSKEYRGVVDEISPTSHQGDVVFNISGKRQTMQFDVKVRFDTSLYPELKNGMSAKIWIYKQ